MSKKVKQLKSSELKDLKIKWLEQQDYLCPITKKTFSVDDFVVDHLHCKAKELPNTENGRGFCRGAIFKNANVVEGKILKDFTRYGLGSHIDIPSFLRNLADYLENNRFHTEDEIFIHPTEKPLKPILSKRSYDLLVKTINGKQKVPNYESKRGNLSKPLEKLFIKYSVTPVFLKD